VVISYRRFGSNYRSHLQGSRIEETGKELPLLATLWPKRTQFSWTNIYAQSGIRTQVSCLGIVKKNHKVIKNRFKLTTQFFSSLGATTAIEWEPHQYRSFTFTHRHTTLGRTLDEWSARCRDLYLTVHNTQKKHTSKQPAGIEPEIPANKLP